MNISLLKLKSAKISYIQIVKVKVILIRKKL